MNTTHISQFIKESCEIQNATTPEDFIGMARAFDWADNNPIDVMTVSGVLMLGMLVNNVRWIATRRTPVTFANGNEGLSPEFIDRQLGLLLNVHETLLPEEFYTAFEKIHPFIDGNGRVGAILFNHLNGTLDQPVHPPAVFSR